MFLKKGLTIQIFLIILKQNQMYLILNKPCVGRAMKGIAFSRSRHSYSRRKVGGDSFFLSHLEGGQLERIFLPMGDTPKGLWRTSSARIRDTVGFGSKRKRNRMVNFARTICGLDGLGQGTLGSYLKNS